MAVTLMTTTGTQEHVNAALGLATETAAPEPASPMAPQVAAKADELPKTPPAVAETPAPAAVAPVDAATESDDEPDVPLDSMTPQQQGAHTRNRLQKRINELVKARYTTEGHLEAANAELARLRQQLGAQSAPNQVPVETRPSPVAPAPSAAAPPAASRPRPKSDDTGSDGTPKYQTYDDYIEDLADWRYEQRDAAKQAQLAQERQVAAQRQQEEQAKEGFAAVQKHIEAFKVDHPDFDELLANPDLKVNDAMLEVLHDPENPLSPAIAYYLAQHPDECKRIGALPPAKAAKAMGLIEAQVAGTNGKSAAKAAPMPKAPPPPTTVRSGGAVSSQSLEELARTVTPGSHATSEWIARRNAERAQRGSR